MVVLEGDKLNILIAISFGELDRLVEIFSLLDELKPEKVATRLYFLSLNFVLCFLSSCGVIGTHLNSERIFDYFDLSHH